MKECSDFFQNKSCECFPCHKGISEENFNCLFCYCPLYTLGENCGGNFGYTEKGTKKCTDCILPHSERGYGYVISKFPEISALERKNRFGEKKND
ncbi:MAG: metal-binding protein [Firmicutes bacterium]|nr:metal-binding protein [Bacillota bacterium]